MTKFHRSTPPPVTAGPVYCRDVLIALLLLLLQIQHKINRKTYFMSGGPNEIKSKITSKTERKLTVKPYPNYGTFI